MRLQEKNGQFFLTVPRKLILAKSWKKGDKVTFTINKQGNLELVKE